MTFYDKKNQPFIQKYITFKNPANGEYYQKLNIAQYKTIKKQLKDYIKNNPKVLDYLIFSQNSKGDIIIYEKLDWIKKIADFNETKQY
jgi:hypothetical protein